MIKSRTLPDLLAQAVRGHADDDAFAFPDERWTYRQLDDRALEITRALISLGVESGDRVGLLMANCLDFMAVNFGVAAAGATLVAMNARYAPPELAHVVADSGMKVLVTTDRFVDSVDHVGRLRAAFPELQADDLEQGRTPTIAGAPALDALVVLGAPAPGFTSRDDVGELAGRVPEDDARARARTVDPGDPYIMMYTSGTTAHPKGCVLSHRSVVRLGLDVGRDRFGLRDGDVMWNPLPMFHVSMQAPMIGVVGAGGTYLSMSHFDPTEGLEQIAAEGADLLFPAYPTILQPLVAHPDYGPDTFAGVRGVLCVGPPDLLRRFQQAMPDAPLVSCYGSTELAGIAVMGRLEDGEDARVTCGKPLPGVEVQIRDLDDGRPVGAGVVGAIHARGYNLFLGYHDDPVRTEEVVDPDGWFDTGDLGVLAEDGSLDFRGRVKDMLKVGGENVAAVEVEAVLGTHADVAQCAVVGRPDPKYDEVPVAFVEVVDGATATADELVAHCRERLASYKVPREVRFVDEWPMSATKVQKFRLRQQLLDESRAVT